jgi:hypothetical protein
MVQVRPNGRFLDNFRVAVGGAQFLQAEFTTASVFSNNLLPATALVLHKRPIDIVIRRNLTTSDWLDVIGLLRSRDLIAGAPEADEDDNEDLLTLIAALEDPGTAQASIRWAVVAGQDHKMHLQLQALPASATNLNSKPIFKG